jgi:hypothetical protein
VSYIYILPIVIEYIPETMAGTDDYDQSLVLEEQHMEIEALESIFMDDLKGTRYFYYYL